jgi:hypothetical protein
VFDTGRYLRETFQTPAGLMTFLSAYGAPTPQNEAVHKWFQRGSIPGNWLPVLLAFTEIDEGKPVTLIPFLTGYAHASGKDKQPSDGK